MSTYPIHNMANQMHQDEKDIQKLMASFGHAKPPASLMQHYEKEVLQKIQASKGGPSVGISFALSLALILTLAIAFGFWIVTLTPTLSLEGRGGDPIAEGTLTPTLSLEGRGGHSKTEIPSPLRGEGQGEGKETEQTDLALYESMTQELLILEMLGEDEGLLDDFKGMAMELDFLGTQIA